jgi:ferredoxin-NADP reductase
MGMLSIRLMIFQGIWLAKSPVFLFVGRVRDSTEILPPYRLAYQQSGERPVVLLSAGIGATPVLAMLYALGAARSTQQGVVDARDSRSAASSIRLRSSLPHARAHARLQLRLLQQAWLARQDG